MEQTRKSELSPVLASRHSHPRDANLVFDEPSHKYTISSDPGQPYVSVTTWNHSHFPHFDADKIIAKMMTGKKWNATHKYWGQTPEQIKQGWSDNAAAVSGAGTQLHFDIECFMNQDLRNGDDDSPYEYTHHELIEIYFDEIKQGDALPPNVSEEWGFFLDFVRAFPDLKPYRTEWMIYHEGLKLAGSIDMVYENADGTLAIYDWKRAKEITKTTMFKQFALTECIAHLPDTNFWHYSLQLNTYKAILEAKYDKKVVGLFLVRLHPDNPRKTFDLIRCADLSAEIEALFQARAESIHPLNS
jgi:ATP-dependent exoDNAse (exonuclease V) beta subunit